MAMFFGEFLCYIVYVIVFAIEQVARLFKRSPDKEQTTPLLDREDTSEGVDVLGSVLDDAELLGDDTSPVADEEKKEKPTLPFWKSCYFFIPAVFDMVGTCTMYIGLIFTYASTYQMLRAFVIVFTFALSVIVLRHRPTTQAVTAIVLIMIGTLVVGWVSVATGDEGGEAAAAKDPFIGNIIVLVAQMFPALQFIIEEKLISRYRVSGLRAVGLEGLCGLVVVMLAMPIMYFIPVPTWFMESGQLENAIEAIYQVMHSPQLVIALSVSIVSIAGFNFCGITITKKMSAGSRATIDSCRTLFIWLISLAMRWESFHTVTIVGFAVLVWGTLMFNKVLPGPKETVRFMWRTVTRGRKKVVPYEPVPEDEYPVVAVDDGAVIV